MNTTYRPKTGTEGYNFDSLWCSRCARDAKFRETGDGEDGCPIVAATFLYEPNDPRYPVEWIKDEIGEPRCTAFVEIGLPLPTPAELEAAGQRRLID